MRSNRLWIGVTCGVALALGVAAAVDAGIQTAGAQAKGQPADQLAQGRKHAMTAWSGTGTPLAGQQLWARVDFDGTIIARSNSSITSTRTAGGLAGDYHLNFNTDLSQCSWSATPFSQLKIDGETVREQIGAVTARVKAQPVVIDPETGRPRADPNVIRVYVFRTAASSAQSPTDNSVVVQVLC